MTLEEAWIEFRQTAADSGVHVGMLEAKQVIQEATSPKSQSQSQDASTPADRELGRFLDWLLYVRKDKTLAYELLKKEGTIAVGPREYWISNQGERRAIAWESRYTYPGTDSEIWNIIFVD